MPSTSAKQAVAMKIAAAGKSNIGIPQSVGKEFVKADKERGPAHEPFRKGNPHGEGQASMGAGGHHHRLMHPLHRPAALHSSTIAKRHGHGGDLDDIDGDKRATMPPQALGDKTKWTQETMGVGGPAVEE